MISCVPYIIKIFNVNVETKAVIIVVMINQYCYPIFTILMKILIFDLSHEILSNIFDTTRAKIGGYKPAKPLVKLKN